MPYAVIARYQCAPEDVETIRDALLAMREHTVSEPANIAYVVHEGVEESGVFILYEQYNDRDGFETHTRTPHFDEHINGFVKPRLIGRTVFFADVI